MAEYLEPVKLVFTLDISDAIAKIAALKQAEKDLATSSAVTGASMSKDGAKVETAFDELGNTVDKNTKKVKDDLDQTGKKTSDFARLVTSNLKDGETASKSLGRALDDLKGKASGLRAAFASTGSQSVFGDLKSTEADIKKLEAFQKAMVPTDLTAEGRKAGESYAAGLVGALAVASPVLLPMISGVITAGVGAGVVALGVYIEKSNPQVVAAFTKTKNDVVHVFQDAAQPMVAPIVDALGILDKGIEHGLPEIRLLFAEAAPAVRDIADDAVRFAAAFGPGLVGLVSSFSREMSDPATQQAITGLGRSVGNLFEAVGNGAPALTDVINLTSTLVNGVAGLINEFDAVEAPLHGVFGFIGSHQQIFGTLTTSILEGVVAWKAYKLATNIDWAKIVAGIGDVTAALKGETAAAGAGGLAGSSAKGGIAGGVESGAAGGAAAGGAGKAGGLSSLLDFGEGYVAVDNAGTAAGGSYYNYLQGEIKQANAVWKKVTSGFVTGVSNADAAAFQKWSDATDTLFASMTDVATEVNTLNADVQSQISLIDQLADTNLGLHQAMTTWDQAIKKGKLDFNENTKAGQANWAMLNQTDEALANYYGQQIQVNGATKESITAYRDAEQKLYDQAKAAGATKDELEPLKETIEKLNGELNDLPKKININVDLKMNTGEVGKINNELNRLGNTAGAAHGGLFQAFAAGGYAPVLHAASGLTSGVLQPRNPGTLVMAGEPETGGEVFAPLRGISQRRAMALAQLIGDAYGFDVSPRAKGRVGGGVVGGGYDSVNVNVNLGGTQMAAVHRSLIQSSQRYKIRTGTTGLT